MPARDAKVLKIANILVLGALLHQEWIVEFAFRGPCSSFPEEAARARWRTPGHLEQYVDELSGLDLLRP